MHRAVVLIASLISLFPMPATAAPSWGSPGYGDPPGLCTHHSEMRTATVVTNDPLVASNPEYATFFGYHPNPGYDDWYGYFYGDFRGSPGDASGWVKLLHEIYPNHYRWNFANNGWAVHGHVKQYIAYYNWTFGGECGMGSYGHLSPPPFMADQTWWPVVDIYVDAVPPYPPSPRVLSVTSSAVAFTWDPVRDRGDGAGKDYFEVGMDHYTSWVTLDGGSARLQLASTANPRTIVQPLAPLQKACVHVQAVDRLMNATQDQLACASALAAPPMPVWPALASTVVADPRPVGLVGLDSWFWLAPTPGSISVAEAYRGIDYVLTAVPRAAAWDFGDGASTRFMDASGLGDPYPARSRVRHTYQLHSQAGYVVRAGVDFNVSWTALDGGIWAGPFPMGTITLDAGQLVYPVQQAQPELVLLGSG
jgi:hypothetical protein